MKTISFLFKLLVIFSPFLSLAQEKNFKDYSAVGKDSPASDIISTAELREIYKDLKPEDSVAVKFRANVSEVCQAKGCWMKTHLQDGQEIMIKFRNYGFFVPKDIAKKEVIINGTAYVTEMSVAEQQHYAEDAGKTAKEIAAIKKPKQSLSFIADGVKIEKEQ